MNQPEPWHNHGITKGVWDIRWCPWRAVSDRHVASCLTWPTAHGEPVVDASQLPCSRSFCKTDLDENKKAHWQFRWKLLCSRNFCLKWVDTVQLWHQVVTLNEIWCFSFGPRRAGCKFAPSAVESHKADNWLATRSARMDAAMWTKGAGGCWLPGSAFVCWYPLDGNFSAHECGSFGSAFLRRWWCNLVGGHDHCLCPCPSTSTDSPDILTLSAREEEIRWDTSLDILWHQPLTSYTSWILVNDSQISGAQTCPAPVPTSIQAHLLCHDDSCPVSAFSRPCRCGAADPWGWGGDFLIPLVNRMSDGVWMDLASCYSSLARSAWFEDWVITLVLEFATPDVRVLFEQVVCSHVSGVWSVTHQNFLVFL